MKRLNMRKKRFNKKGETIVETLYSTLIIALTFLMLAGAIVSAARINASINNTEYSLDAQGKLYDNIESGKRQITITDAAGENNYSVDVDLYKTEHDYYYFE